jgi:hypothetical protein
VYFVFETAVCIAQEEFQSIIQNELGSCARIGPYNQRGITGKKVKNNNRSLTGVHKSDTTKTNPIMWRLMTTKYFPLYITYSKKAKFEGKYFKIRRKQYATCIPFLKDLQK